MSATSINIQPIKSNSEMHNKREKDLSYVRKELSPLNERYEAATIAGRMAEIKARYTETTGQKMQQKASPIREGVVVIGKDTTMEQLKDFAQQVEQRFGIKTLQIHIHRDEGFMNARDWKPNLHAHMVFDWTDKGGKSLKLNRLDMSQMQTMLANSLQMDRGVTSDKKHLTALQYKNAAESARAAELGHDLEAKMQHLSELKTEIAKTELSKNAQKVLSKGAEKITDLLGMTKNDREKEGLKTALNDAETTIKNQAHQIRQLEYDKSTQSQKLASLRGVPDENKYLKELLRKENLEGKMFRKELGSMFNQFSPEQWDAIKQNWPKVHEAARLGIDEAKTEQTNTQERKKGFGRGM